LKTHRGVNIYALVRTMKYTAIYEFYEQSRHVISIRFVRNSWNGKIDQIKALQSKHLDLLKVLFFINKYIPIDFSSGPNNCFK